MSHPVALQCAALTKECRRQFIELDRDLAASESEDMQMLSNSRDTIARARGLLKELNGRTAQ
jgi:hypothetical protein